MTWKCLLGPNVMAMTIIMACGYGELYRFGIGEWCSIMSTVLCHDRSTSRTKISRLPRRYGAWKKIHRQKPFDVVQAANVQCVGLFFRRVRNAPVVIRLSSYHPYWDQATGVSPTASVRLRWKLDEWTLLRRQYVYAPSHFVAQKVAQAYGLQRVEVVEPPFFQPIAHRDYVQYEEHGLGHNYALFFGRLTRMKGVHILAAALPKILAEFPNLRFLLIGADATAPDGGSMREYVRRKLDPACRNRVLMLIRYHTTSCIHWWNC